MRSKREGEKERDSEGGWRSAMLLALSQETWLSTCSLQSP